MKTKLIELRELIKEMYDYWVENTDIGHYKSSEGYIVLTQEFDSYFNKQKKERWTIYVYSYVFCDSRSIRFEGENKDEIIQKAIDYFKDKFEEYKKERSMKNERKD